MNRLHSASILSFCLLMLTGCLHKSGDKNDTIYSFGSHSSSTVVADNTNNNDEVDPVTSDDPATVNCEVTPVPLKKFTRIQVTYGLLDEGAFIPGESGGLLPIKLSEPATQGTTTIQIDPIVTTTSLIEDQLLTYLGSNGFYSVGQIQSITTDTITLKEPLIYDLAAGDNSLWNFYDDPSHANNIGFTALADFAYNNAFDVLEPNKVHALLGDSWFRRNGETPFANRLLERLPSGSVIQNEGLGGDSLSDLLVRVDDVLANYNPDYVWINSSINDYFDDVTAEQYKARMKELIGKIQAVGKIAIVMDPAPGSPTQVTSDVTTPSFNILHQRYATQILDLLAEATACNP